MYPLQLTTLLTVFFGTPSDIPSSVSPSRIEALVERANQLNLSEDRFWHLLVRYQDGVFGYESEADKPSFFLSPSGKTDPKAELEATIRRLLAGDVPSGEEAHPQCRFPARYKWLWRQLHLENEKVPPVHCPEVLKFLYTMQPNRVVLVFASAFLNAPPSMFGHTFLRFDNVNHPETLMLSNIINFAANPTTQNPLAYTVMGIFGGFQGRFAGMPYYVKIREYSDMESRDLWEYEIPLSADQIDWMLRYAWDLDQTHFDYFFFTENCSYHILDIINIAYPDLALENDLPTFSLPIDSIKMLRKYIGNMKEPVFRPSHVTKMQARRASLRSEEADVASQIAQGQSKKDFDALKNFSQERQAVILDAAHDRFKYLTGFEDRVQDDEAKAINARGMAILNVRRDIPIPTIEPEFPTPPPPHSGHDSSRLALAVGSLEDGRMFGEIWYRRVLHDALDKQEGFVPNNHLEMFAFKLRIQPHAFQEGKKHVNGVLLERLDFVRIMSILPITDWMRPISWRANMHYGRVADLGCLEWDCTALTLEGGPGFAFESRLVGKELFYGFTEIHLSVGPAYKDSARLSASGSAGLLLEPLSFWRIQAEVSYFVDYPTPEALKIHRFGLHIGSNIAFTENFALRAEMTQERDTREGVLSVLFYH